MLCAVWHITSNCLVAHSVPQWHTSENRAQLIASSMPSSSTGHDHTPSAGKKNGKRWTICSDFHLRSCLGGEKVWGLNPPGWVLLSASDLHTSSATWMVCFLLSLCTSAPRFLSPFPTPFPTQFLFSNSVASFYQDVGCCLETELNQGSSTTAGVSHRAGQCHFVSWLPKDRPSLPPIISQPCFGHILEQT